MSLTIDQIKEGDILIKTDTRREYLVTGWPMHSTAIINARVLKEGKPYGPRYRINIENFEHKK